MKTLPTWRKLVVVTAGLAAALAGCGPPNERPDIARSLETAVADAGDGGIIDVATLVPAEWDSFFGFAGYTTDAEITAATGVDFGSSDDSKIPYDGRNLIVLVDRDRVAAWFVLNAGVPPVAVRLKSDFYGVGIPRDDAVFTAVVSGEKTVGGKDVLVLVPATD